MLNESSTFFTFIKHHIVSDNTQKHVNPNSNYSSFQIIGSFRKHSKDEKHDEAIRYESSGGCIVRLYNVIHLINIIFLSIIRF